MKKVADNSRWISRRFRKLSASYGNMPGGKIVCLIFSFWLHILLSFRNLRGVFSTKCPKMTKTTPLRNSKDALKIE